MASEPKLSVVMATYKRAETLKETIRHLVNQELDPTAFEVIIIDDASPDNTGEVVEEAIGRVPFRMKYLRHETNRGPGFTENRGIREALAPIILLMADDIWMTPRALREHLEFHEAHPEPEVAVMGRVLQSPKLDQTVFLRNWDPFRFTDVDGGVELPYYRFWANNISVKRAFLMAHGLFRVDMGRGGAAAHEDSELGYRLHKAGLRILYNAAALGHHYHFVTLDGAIKRWYERGVNWGELRACVPAPELPVAYHILNLQTVRDHVRTFFSPRRKYLMGADRNPALLLLRHVFRFAAFNRLTTRYLWRPLFERAESSPTLARVMNRQFYRLFLYYYFLKGVRDAEPVYGRVPGDDRSVGSGSPRW